MEKTQVERGEASLPRGLNRLDGAVLWGFLWPVPLLFLASSPYLASLRAAPPPSPVFTQHLLAKTDSSTRVSGPPLLTLEEPFRACVVRKVSLTLILRNG